LDIFEMTSDGHEPIKNVWIKNYYHFDDGKLTSRTSRAHCSGGINMKICSLLSNYLHDKYWAFQVFKLNVNNFFCWQAFVTNLLWCRILIDNLNKPIFVNCIWHNDPSIGCHGPKDLARLGKKFKGGFEHEELIDLPHR
jgi:hypothetical protein